MQPINFRRESAVSALAEAWESLRRKIVQPKCSRATCSSHRLPALWSSPAPVRFGGMWFCSPACAEPAIRRCLDQVRSQTTQARRHPHRVPLGLLLLSRGELSEDQLQTALEAQRTGEPRRIGEWLQILHLASEQQVLAGLGLQWALPILSSPPAVLQSCASLLPAMVRRELRLVPVRHVGSSNELFLACSEQADQTVLASIAQMLSCRIQACLVSERTLSRWLEADLGVDEDTTQSFERVHSLAEILRITCSYAARLSSDEVRIARCQSQIWVRLSRRNKVTHLLFRFSDPSLALEADSPYLPAAV